MSCADTFLKIIEIVGILIWMVLGFFALVAIIEIPNRIKDLEYAIRKQTKEK